MSSMTNTDKLVDTSAESSAPSMNTSVLSESQGTKKDIERNTAETEILKILENGNASLISKTYHDVNNCSSNELFRTRTLPDNGEAQQSVMVANGCRDGLENISHNSEITKMRQKFQIISSSSISRELDNKGIKINTVNKLKPLQGNLYFKKNISNVNISDINSKVLDKNEVLSKLSDYQIKTKIPCNRAESTNLVSIVKCGEAAIDGNPVRNKISSVKRFKIDKSGSKIISIKNVEPTEEDSEKTLEIPFLADSEKTLEIPFLADSENTLEIPFLADSEKTIEIPFNTDSAKTLEIPYSADSKQTLEMSYPEYNEKNLEIPYPEDGEKTLEIATNNEMSYHIKNTVPEKISHIIEKSERLSIIPVKKCDQITIEESEISDSAIQEDEAYSEVNDTLVIHEPTSQISYEKETILSKTDENDNCNVSPVSISSNNYIENKSSTHGQNITLTDGENRKEFSKIAFSGLQPSPMVQTASIDVSESEFQEQSLSVSNPLKSGENKEVKMRHFTPDEMEVSTVLSELCNINCSNVNKKSNSDVNNDPATYALDLSSLPPVFRGENDVECGNDSNDSQVSLYYPNNVKVNLTVSNDDCFQEQKKIVSQSDSTVEPHSNTDRSVKASVQIYEDKIKSTANLNPKVISKSGRKENSGTKKVTVFKKNNVVVKKTISPKLGKIEKKIIPAKLKNFGVKQMFSDNITLCAQDNNSVNEKSSNNNPITIRRIYDSNERTDDTKSTNESVKRSLSFHIQSNDVESDNISSKRSLSFTIQDNKLKSANKSAGRELCFNMKKNTDSLMSVNNMNRDISLEAKFSKPEAFLHGSSFSNSFAEENDANNTQKRKLEGDYCEQNKMAKIDIERNQEYSSLSSYDCSEASALPYGNTIECYAHEDTLKSIALSDQVTMKRVIPQTNSVSAAEPINSVNTLTVIPVDKGQSKEQNKCSKVNENSKKILASKVNKTVPYVLNSKNISDEVQNSSSKVDVNIPPVPPVPFPFGDENSFDWDAYLRYTEKYEGASVPPQNLWKSLPLGIKNPMKKGMKLEGVDPLHPQKICVLSVTEVVGHRVLLHFEGFSANYNFWINWFSPNLFPVGWCEKNCMQLEIPPHITNFSWDKFMEYNKLDHSFRFSKECAKNTDEDLINNVIRPGMKLEAYNPFKSALYASTIAEIRCNKLLLTFDGTEDAEWYDADSPHIHPYGWASKNNKVLYSSKDEDCFHWLSYLRWSSSEPVPSFALVSRESRPFKKMMKVEAVDKRNPQLIRVATIVDTRPYEIKLHFDGWDSTYDYWVNDDSEDIFPPRFCQQNGHPLQPPLTQQQIAMNVDNEVGCDTPGCRGIGHIRGQIYHRHHTVFGCPYSIRNINDDIYKNRDRLINNPKNSCKEFLVMNLGSSKAEKPNKRVRKRRMFFDEISDSKKTNTSQTNLKISEAKNIKTTLPSTSPNNNSYTPNTSHIKNNTRQCQVQHSISKTKIREKSKTPPQNNSGSSTPKSREEVVTPTRDENKIPKSNSSSAKIIKSNNDVTKKLVQQIFSSSFEHDSREAKVNKKLFDVSREYLLNKCRVQLMKIISDPQSNINQIVHKIENKDTVLTKDIIKLSTSDICKIVMSIKGCENCVDTFIDHDIDGNAFMMLTLADMIDVMHLKLGQAKKIMAFKNNVVTGSD